MALAYLQIFADKEELLEPLDDAERGRLLTAMMAYALHDIAPVLTGNERYVWPVFRQMIDQSKAALASKQAGGRARQNSSGQQTAAESQQEPAGASRSQQRPAESPIIQESRIKNQESRVKNQERGGKRARFSPPSEADVAAYAAEKGLKVNAHRFVSYYAATGWKMGKTPMEDWRPAVDSWASRDEPGQAAGNRSGPKTVEQQQYTQREYKHDESALDAMMAEFQARGVGA